MRTHSNNLVIVCEGTDTEYQYFTDLKEYVMAHQPDRYCAIKVVPVPVERIDRKNPKRNHLARKLSNVPQYHYYCKYEDNAENYNLYCAQPAMSGRRFSLCKRTVMMRDGRFSTATSIPPVRMPSVMQNKPMWASPSRPIRSKSGCWPISSVAHNRFSILSARLTTRKSAAVRLLLVMEIATERIASEAD